MTRWHNMSIDERWTTVEDNFRRMLRTGSQAVIGGLLVSDAGPVNAFTVDYKLVLGSFVGGCVVWLCTTLAAPPKG